jgi:hypothetical protein
MQSLGILFIVLAIMAVIAFVVYSWYKSPSSYNYETDYSTYGGSRKHKKYMHYMPMKMHLILALIFAYIVYSMFYNY